MGVRVLLLGVRLVTFPAEVIYFCGECRDKTLHRLAPGLRSAALYGCTKGCGSPLKEISEPETRTPARLQIQAANEEALRKEWQQDESREWKKRSRREVIEAVEGESRQRARPPKIEPARPAKEKPMAKDVLKGGWGGEHPLLAEIRKIVREEVQIAAPGLVRQGLLGLAGGSAAPAAAKPGKLAPLPEGFKCPRAPHKGYHGRACREAAGLA